VLALVVALAIAGGAFVWMFMRGSLGVDDWVVRQVTAIAQTYVVPTMRFDSFNYQAPRTVELDGVSFTAPDGTEVIDAGRLVLTLAEIPRRGKPIVIERVELVDTVLRLVRDPDVDGVLFKGLAPFVKRQNIRRQSELNEQVRLSNVLELRQVRLNNMGFEYVPGTDLPPLTLDGFDVAMDVDANEGAPDGSADAWHTIGAVLDRGRILHLDLNGRINLDTFEIVFENTRLRQQIDSETITVLPPQWQKMLTDANAAGRLDVTIDGSYPPASPEAADLDVAVALEGVNFDIGKFRIETDDADIALSVHDGVAKAEPIAISAYDGTIDGAASWPLADDEGLARVNWQIHGVQLEQLLRAGARNETGPTLAGTLRLIGSAAMDTDDPRATVSGAGSGRVRQGRLAIVPVIDEIIDATSILATGQSLPTQSLDLEYSFERDWVRFTSIDFSADVFALKGNGTLGYDGSLDLVFRGGPIKRLTDRLGLVGRALQGVAGQALAYRVRGTVGEPTVSTRPLGIGGALDR